MAADLVDHGAAEKIAIEHIRWARRFADVTPELLIYAATGVPRSGQQRSSWDDAVAVLACAWLDLADQCVT